MTDDPREILKAAGVECVEAERYWAETRVDPPSINVYVADAAIRALARLVAKYKTDCETRTLENQHLADLASERSQAADKYKWQRDEAVGDIPEDWDWNWHEKPGGYLVELDRRWDERSA